MFFALLITHIAEYASMINGTSGVVTTEIRVSPEPLTANEDLHSVSVDVNESSVDCMICFETIEEQERLNLVNCTHVFDRTCMQRWISTQRQSARRPTIGNCPICRTDVTLAQFPIIPRESDVNCVQWWLSGGERYSEDVVECMIFNGVFSFSVTLVTWVTIALSTDYSKTNEYSSPLNDYIIVGVTVLSASFLIGYPILGILTRAANRTMCLEHRRVGAMT